ncbi:MAG: gamma-glutamylcyclotransferase family protein, partial [Sulfitobacter sp.]|uniref:gamma-glutamylcyclotransferase family protein n=1 Tax=Sulfitobacter sp. TaxID=1903071 RepID=UPI003298D500
MIDLFFYGTLRYVPLLELVLGRGGDDLDVTPVSLTDHQVFSVQDQIFPMIAEVPGAAAQGLLVRGLSDRDLAMLDYYEGGFDYGLKPVTLTLPSGDLAAAQVYFPAPGT